MNEIEAYLASKMLENEQNNFKEMITFADKIKNLQVKFKNELEKTKGVISNSMNIHTKVSRKLEYKGHWILVEGNISDEDFNELKEKLK